MRFAVVEGQKTIPLPGMRDGISMFANQMSTLQNIEWNATGRGDSVYQVLHLGTPWISRGTQHRQIISQYEFEF